MIGTVLALGLLLALTGSAVAAAAIAVSQVELARWVARRLRGARAAAIVLERPRDMITVANSLTAIGVLVASLTIPGFMPRQASFVTFLGVTVFGAGPLFILLAHIIPRAIGTRWPGWVLKRSSLVLRLASRLLGLLLPKRDQQPRVDLAEVIREGQLRRGGEGLDAISSVVGFAEAQAREVMTPRTGVVALPEGMPLREVARAFLDSGYSRLPVYRESMDNVVGMIHALDLLRIGPGDPLPVRAILHAPVSQELPRLLLEMQRRHTHMAVVVDEYGGTAGIVTLDDVLEELVGELFDDANGEETAPEPAADHLAAVLEIEGSARLDEVESHFGVTLRSSGGPETVSGFLSAAQGRIPARGERLSIAGLEFDVLASTATRLERVMVRHAPGRVTVIPAAAPTDQ